MRERFTAVAFALVVLVSSVSLALPGAGAGGDNPFENLDPGSSLDQRSALDDPEPGDTDTTPGTTFASVEALHETGIEGEGVSVGVIGNQFAANHQSLSGSVADSRQFGGPQPLLAGDRHDTAVAEIVSRTAPEAELYLAGVGSVGTPERYAAAVEWLIEQDVDVVVDAASYFPADAEGMERLNAIATEAADNGVVFVTSAGNYADRHWRGTATEAGWVEFEPGTAYNSLGDGPVSGTASLRLYWQGDADFDLYLYRNDPGEDTLVAKSETNQTTDGSHSEAIDVTLPRGEYYVAVRGDAVAANTTVELFSAGHDLTATSDSGGMVAPATAENVIAVGAVDAVSGDARPYSSSGSNLDILAPDGARTQSAGEFYGSSAAAPLVAGTVALMASENESLTPAETQQVLERTAVRVDGRLYLDTPGAVSSVASRPLPRPTRTGWHTTGPNRGPAEHSGAEAWTERNASATNTTTVAVEGL
jgi:hypothetical protein